jgi:LysM repeat protein
VVHAHLDAAALPAGLAHGARSATTQSVTTGAATTGAATTEAASARAAHAAHAQAAIGGNYAVQAGNTLSGITQRFYGKDANWRSLYAANESAISDPNVIYVGEELRLPRHLPAPAAVPAAAPASGGSTHTAAYTPRHAASSSAASATSGQASTTTTTNLAGTLSCSGLEALWVSAGGSPAVEVTAASIAMAESGGNQFATGTVGERGYWQINPVNGALSIYDPYGNARAAVTMSADGANWSPWTTYTSGAYAGRC